MEWKTAQKIGMKLSRKPQKPKNGQILQKTHQNKPQKLIRQTPN